MKRILVLLLVFCLLIPLNGCSYGTKLDLEEYSNSIDWGSDERPLLGERISFSLTENATEAGISFALHPDLGKLIVLFTTVDEDASLWKGVILEMDVEYDSCEDLVSKSEWRGVLRNVYENHCIIHENVGQSIGPLSHEMSDPEDISGDCYGLYFSDPEDPDRYVSDGYTMMDPYRIIGLHVMSGKDGVPWGFQEYVYDLFKIEGLSQAD